jgi:phosphatidylserine decarboxylase
MVRDGYYYGFALLAIAGVLRYFTAGHAYSLILVAIPVLLAAFFLWFFRDPNRTIPQGPGVIVSPADGKVTEIASIHTPAGPATRISVFLSVFNVHVNRSPVEGILSEVTYKKGEFLNALNPASAERNEQNLVVVEGDYATVSFKQIAGLLARRIVFNFKQGDRVERGQRVGLIKFGSRVDIVLPADAKVRVQLGDKVSGGSSILADLESVAAAPIPRRHLVDPQAEGRRA